MRMPQHPHTVFETYVRCKLSTMYADTECCMRVGMRLQYIAAKLTGLSSFQKHRKPRRYASGPNFASEIC